MFHQETKEDVQKVLCKTALKLVKDFDVSIGSIFQLITKTFEENCTRLPAIPVLYNGCYGGYQKSEDFYKYLSTVKVMKDPYENPRVTYAKMMGDYGGRYIKTTYPFVYDILYTFFKTKIADICKKYRLIVNEIKKIEALDYNVKLLDDYLEKDVPCNKNLEKCMKLGKYLLTSKLEPSMLDMLSKEDIQTFRKSIDVDSIKGEYTLMIKSLRKEQYIPCNLPDSFEEVLIEFLKNHQVNKISVSDLLSFTEAIEKYGETSETIWNHQNYGENTSLIFLTHLKSNHQHIYESFKTNKSMLSPTEVDTKIGLFCASGQYSSLEISYVPCYVNWKISDYDGLETVETCI